MLYLLGALIQGLGIFLLQPITLHVLNDDVKWQELFLSISVIQVGVVFATAGLPLEITNSWYGPDGPRRSRAISGFLSYGGAVLGLVAGAVYAVIASSTGWSITFALAIFAVGLQSSILAAQAMFRAQGKPGGFIILSLASSMGAYGVGLLCMLCFGAEPLIFMTGYVSGILFSVIVAWAWTRPGNPLKIPGLVRESLRLGLPVLPHSGAMMLLTQGMPFLLAVIAIPGLSGDYGKVQIFVLGTITVLNALNNVWVASIMSAQGQERRERVEQSVRLASWVSFALVVLAGCAANVVVHLMAQGRESLIPLAQIMPLVGIGYALFLNASTLMFAERRTGWFAVLTPAALIIAVAAASWPATHDSLVGVGIASALGFLVLGVIFVLMARRYLVGSWPWGVPAITAGASIVVVLALRLVPTDLGSGLVTLGCATVLTLAAGVAFVVLRRRRAAV